MPAPGGPTWLAVDVLPPRSGRLAGQRDHRVDEYQQPHRQPRADERGHETGDRLRHEHHVVARPDRAGDRVSVVGQAGAIVVVGRTRSTSTAYAASRDTPLKIA